MFHNQNVPVQRLTYESLAQSSVEWDALYHGKRENRPPKTPLPHQSTAIDKCAAHFAEHDRGKLIMACGTGKTYTALLLAEKMAARSVLVLVPSIAFVNQTLNAWTQDAETDIKPICVCSDRKSSSARDDDVIEDDASSLILPATTVPRKIAERYLKYEKELAENAEKGMIAVFSTYQSIDAVADAQREIAKISGQPHAFDLIICDEAHRTTGIVKPGEGRSDFTKIHDADFMAGKKRLYMTATPRLYADNVKIRARQSDYELCSMDDENLYGKEIHRVSFGYAVANDLLTDYKVLVLTVGSEYQLPEALRAQVRDPDCKELNFDISSKLIGCVNGLAKNTVNSDNALVWEEDPRIMRRAIAFCGNIDKKGDPASSKNVEKIFPLVSRSIKGQGHDIHVEARHVDGTMDAAKRASAMMWLAEDIRDSSECRVVCNVRCLSEGVDVPALDAAVFLSPRNSQIDVVQSVGRVMRNFHKGCADEKKFGYIIIPIVVNPNIPADEALNDNQTFAVLWSILNALRAHDERFNAMINSIALNREKPAHVPVLAAPFYGGDATLENGENAEELQNGIYSQMSLLREVDGKLYAKMVEKVGSRLYWERWARNMAPLVKNLIARIDELLRQSPQLASEFADFITALRKAVNDSVTERQALEMLGQHLVTRPVFEALFAEYQFEENNAVTRAMASITSQLLKAGLEKDTEILREFYQSVKRNLGEVHTLSGKQTVIKNLYDSFFKGAFPLAVEQLGVVYTPVECVDFILRSVNQALKQEFGLELTNSGVHILDPFTGTGTFITRLLQSGLIRPQDLERKYLQEIHANEIMLLAYYVADVNIESVYHELSAKKEYQRFDGICLTDTFALTEMEELPLLLPFLQDNFKSMEREQKAPVRVIIGNPPYSAGQKSGNDNAQNLKYPALDRRIEETYVANSTATLRNSLYDSYIRAFRWATDRLKKNNEGGVIGFITNGGWLDGNAAAGFRKSLQREFTSIYVFSLRGDARTQGELRKKEGGGIFDSGSRAPVVITILVYNPAKQDQEAEIFYSDIGDYLTREKKLQIISQRSGILDKAMNWQKITPDAHGDWLTKRSELFDTLIPIGDKKDKKNEKTFFKPEFSMGVATSRDAWCWNFSKTELEKNIQRAIEFYNVQCEMVKAGKELNRDAKLFSWSRGAINNVKKDLKFDLKKGNFTVGVYRPFTVSNFYFSRQLNEMVLNIPQIFPNKIPENLVICLSGPGGKKDFSCLIINKIPNLDLIEKGQCFPLHYYVKRPQGELTGSSRGDYEKKSAITDWILRNVRERFGYARAITRETIFYYVYGILHSPDYRLRFADDLKKQLPRLPICEKAQDFIAFAQAGEKLADLHLNYASQPPCPQVTVSGEGTSNFHVEKMRFPGKAKAYDKTRIIYNSAIEVGNIPLKAYDYAVNGRSAIEWIMESYRIKTDADSGIVNDPNAWARESGNPRYILDLLLSIFTLSLKTLEIVESLPKLEWGEPPA